VSVEMTIPRKLAYRAYLACCFTEMGGLRRLRRHLLAFITGQSLKGLMIDRTVQLRGVDQLELGR